MIRRQLFYVHQKKRIWQISEINKVRAIAKWKQRAAYMTDDGERQPVEGVPSKVCILTPKGKFIKV